MFDFLYTDYGTKGGEVGIWCFLNEQKVFSLIIDIKTFQAGKRMKKTPLRKSSTLSYF